MDHNEESIRTEVVEERESNGSSRTMQPSIENLRKEHLENKAGIEQLLRTIPPSDGYDSKRPTLQADGKNLEASGIALEHIPDFLRPAYIKIINLINKPDERLSKKREQVESVVKELDGIAQDLTGMLFGSQYRGVEGNVGGLHKKYQESGNGRYQCAKAIVTLEEEIQNTYTRIKSTEEVLTERLNDSARDANISELAGILAGYKFDLDRYEDVKGDLEGDLEAHDQEIKYTSINLKATKELRDYVRDAVKTTRNELKKSKVDTSHREYTKSITEIMPILREKVLEYGEMLKVFKEEKDRQLSDVVTVAGQTIKPMLPEGVHHDPFKYHQGEREKKSEQISARAQEILKSPFGDMYKV